jgi:hypothetical protein
VRRRRQHSALEHPLEPRPLNCHPLGERFGADGGAVQQRPAIETQHALDAVATVALRSAGPALEVPDIAAGDAGAERNGCARGSDNRIAGKPGLAELEQHLAQARLGLLPESVRPQQIEQHLATLAAGLLQRQISQQGLAPAQRDGSRAPAGRDQSETSEKLKLHATPHGRRPGSRH